MKLPFVKRSDYEELEKQNVSKQCTISSLKDELKTANEVAEKVLPRLFNIDVRRNREFSTYRICVDFHRDMVERAFTHGGDDSHIEYIAHQLAHEIERKIVQFNFARCDY